MITEFTHIEQLDAFFSGNLSETERHEIRQRVASDPAFAAEFGAYSDIVEGLKTKGDLDLKAKIRQTHEAMKVEGFLGSEAAADLEKGAGSGAKVVPLRRWKNYGNWVLAAAAVVVLALGLWWLLRPNVPEQLFAAHYAPEKTQLIEKLDELESSGYVSQEVDKLLLNGLRSYEKGDYEKAIVLLSEYVEKAGKNADDAAVFYLALSYLEQHDLINAIPKLESIANKKNSIWQPDAAYYLGLAYLKTNNVQQAKMWFEKAASGASSPYSEKAKKTLDGLKN